MILTNQILFFETDIYNSENDIKKPSIFKGEIGIFLFIIKENFYKNLKKKIKGKINVKNIRVRLLTEQNCYFRISERSLPARPIHD